MSTNDLRTEYLDLRKTSGLSAAKFDNSCRYMMMDRGIDAPAPADWVEAAKDVLRWNAAKTVKSNGKCGRCGGLGIIPAFVGVNGGECFECG